MKEQWRDIKGFEGHYMVSSFGRVASIKNRGFLIRKLQLNTDGYWQIDLYKNGQKSYKVHRLVAIAFIKKNKKDLIVNHKDCDKKNNNISNLEWVTHRENIVHGILNGCWDLARAKARKPVASILDDKVVKKYTSISEAALDGYNTGHISACCKGKRITHKGYKWQYL